MRINKLLIVGCASLFSLGASAQAVFDGYEDYYQTLPGRTFKLRSASGFEGAKMRTISWRGHQLKKKALVFPGETATELDLGPRPVIYEQPGWACIEGQASAGSGTAARYFAVYIIDHRTAGSIKLFKLPSLFASCLNVRVDQHGHFLFDRAAYVWSNDSPTGTIFSEYVIDGRRFKPTGHRRAIEYVEDRNVWKFKIAPIP